ncbi:hypothetical protein D3C81_1486970 [compost metagenome]|jgi:hypothetical protein|uniref:hypothetical protein n=1 Tax=Stenotrophomonas lactitubi TaxID=2045214 RepID=UPI000FBB1AF2|nr:hypothetical protein [Stenotrophomonas maltophilia]
MQNLRMIVATVGIAVGTAGCGPVEWQVSASCEETKKCRIEGKIGGKIGGGERSSIPWYERLLKSSTSEIPDAAQFDIDISGSSVAFPANGLVTLLLFDSRLGAATAARQFHWQRSGNSLTLSNPDEVNAWAAGAAGTADELRYDLAAFDVGAVPGPNTIAASSRYQGATKAASVSDFQVCTKYPSPYQCGMTP